MSRMYKPYLTSQPDTEFQVKSSPFYLYGPKSQGSHGAFQSVQYTTPSVLRPLEQIRKNAPKQTLTGKKWKKPQEEKDGQTNAIQLLIGLVTLISLLATVKVIKTVGKVVNVAKSRVFI